MISEQSVKSGAVWQPAQLPACWSLPKPSAAAPRKIFRPVSFGFHNNGVAQDDYDAAFLLSLTADYDDA